MTGTELILPASGELIDITDPAACARALYELRELKDRIKEIESVLKETVFDESLRQGGKTLHFEGGFTAKISTPNETRWDYSVLLELIDAGLPEERFNELVMIEQTYKVDGSIIRQLQGANPAYAEIIGRAKEVIPRTPFVSVSPGKAQM